MDKPKPSADSEDDSQTTSKSPTRGVNLNINSPRKSPGPQTAAQMEQLLVGADRLERMILAHELAVNNDFKVENTIPQEGSLEAKVKETMQQAFWDALQSSLSLTPPDLTHALILLEEIRETLLSFLPDGQGLQMREVIRQNLDIEHIRTQANHDALDFGEKAQFIISIMGRLCAPARDEEIKQLSKVEEIMPLFRQVFHVLEEMKMDMLNFTLKQIRPIIDQHSVEYEQQMFDEFLATQEDSLNLTKEWLRRTAVDLLQIDDGSRIPSISPPPNGSGSPWKVSPTRLIRCAFLNLLDWNPGPYPETLTADISRILALQMEAENTVICAALLLITWNVAGARLTSASTIDFKLHLKDEILALAKQRTEDDRETLTTVAEHVLVQVQKKLAEEKQSDDLTGLREQLIDVHRRDHPVRVLLMKRLKETIEALSTTNRAPPPSQHIPAALLSVRSEVLQIADLFVRIVSRNQRVFGKYYSELIAVLADELGLRTVDSLPSSPSKHP